MNLDVPSKMVVLLGENRHIVVDLTLTIRNFMYGESSEQKGEHETRFIVYRPQARPLPSDHLSSARRVSFASSASPSLTDCGDRGCAISYGPYSIVITAFPPDANLCLALILLREPEVRQSSNLSGESAFAISRTKDS